MSITDRITDKLNKNFHPQHLEVINESHQHNVPAGSESHFKVIIVSESFVEQSLVKRHRALNECLAAELAESVHALSLKAYTPDEWQAKGTHVEASPPCLGGSKEKS